MSLETVYESGNTVKLTCKFYDESGNLVDPDSVKVITYNYKYEKIEEYTGNITRVSKGIYTYNYTTPVSTGKERIYYEWNGIINGNTAIKRSSITSDFLVRG